MAAIPKCCICCNVKLGTILISSLVMLSGILGIMIMSYSLAHPNAHISVSDLSSGNGNDSYALFYNADLSPSSKWLSLAFCAFVSLIGCLGLLGVAKNNHSHLWPLMVLLLFIILRTLISLCSVIFSWYSIRFSIALCSKLPANVQKWLLSLNDYQLAFVVYGSFFLGLMVKFYLFSVVHNCYNHIKQRTKADVEAGSPKSDEASTVKLPDYGDIHKFPLVNSEEGAKPPPYEA